MTISFPSSPVLNQQYTYSNRTWQWNGSAWQSVGTPSAQGLQGIQGNTNSYLISSTQPSYPVVGSGWITTNDGRTYIWDGTEWFEPYDNLIGPQGSMGLTGAQGLQGLQGGGFNQAQGIQGLQGPQGPQGLPGQYAAMGVQGTQGIQGNLGIQGTTGAGLQGTTGLQGVQGVQGLIGPLNSGKTIILSMVFGG